MRVVSRKNCYPGTFNTALIDQLYGAKFVQMGEIYAERNSYYCTIKFIFSKIYWNDSTIIEGQMIKIML